MRIIFKNATESTRPSRASLHITCRKNIHKQGSKLDALDALHPFTYYRKYKYIKSIGGDRGISRAFRLLRAVSRGAAL